MPIQDGHNPLKGTVDNLTYYKTKDGYKVRKKGGIAPGLILKDPRFARTRENLAEFAEVAHQNKLIRESFRNLLQNIADKRIQNRLTSVLFEVIQADMTNLHGSRKVASGDLQLLKDFDFNGGNTLSRVFGVHFTSALDRAAGTTLLTVPAFVPDQSMYAPFEATHFRIVYAAAELDLVTGNFKFTSKTSDSQEIMVTTVPALTLDLNFQPNSTLPLFVLVGINFYQETNGAMNMLKNGAFNALRIVEVNTP